MATAKTRFVKQAKPVEYVDIMDGIELNLTEQEAQFLVDLVDFVGGSPTRSRRKYADSIKAALEGVGYVPPRSRRREPAGAQDVVRDSHGEVAGVYFKDTQ